MKDVHLNDEEQYLLSMLSMLNNNYMLNQVVHRLDEIHISQIKNQIEQNLYSIDISIVIDLEDYQLDS